MKAIIFVGLLALACSSSVFRSLQSNNPPDNNAIIGGNATNGTNSTDEEAPMAANNNVSGLNFSQLFDGSGTYILVSSNCTVLVFNTTTNQSDIEGETPNIQINQTNSSLCFPQLVLQVDNANNSVNVSFIYPLNISCGNFSNQTINFTYPYANGIFMGNNATEDTFFTGIFLINNRSVMSFANDTYNTSDVCYANWAPLNATNGPNVTNASSDSESAAAAPSDSESAQNSTNATLMLWEGVWNVSTYQNTSTNMTNLTCCVPDSPLLIAQDNATETIFYMFRAPDCPECGSIASTVTYHNVSIVGGAGTETDLGVLSYFYNVNNTLIYVTPGCYIVYEPVAPIPCANATNSSDNEQTAGGSR